MHANVNPSPSTNVKSRAAGWDRGGRGTQSSLQRLVTGSVGQDGGRRCLGRHLEIGQASHVDHGGRAAQARHDAGARREQPIPNHVLRARTQRHK